MTALTFTNDELRELTGYVRQAEQLRALHEQGFWRARRLITGRVILERSHYEAVCRGLDDDPQTPGLLPA